LVTVIPNASDAARRAKNGANQMRVAFTNAMTEITTMLAVAAGLPAFAVNANAMNNKRPKGSIKKRDQTATANHLLRGNRSSVPTSEAEAPFVEVA
jgi:hypothetical protein